MARMLAGWVAPFTTTLSRHRQRSARWHTRAHRTVRRMPAGRGACLHCCERGNIVALLCLYIGWICGAKRVVYLAFHMLLLA